MYIPRFARQDLLRAVGALTTMITHWDELCDRKLFQIIKYTNGTVEWRQVGFAGDTTESLQLGLFSDADFARDRADVDKKHLGCVLLPYMAHATLPRSPRRAKSKQRCHTAPSRPNSWRQTTLFERAGCQPYSFGKG